jgi:hypothetical protein
VSGCQSGIKIRWSLFTENHLFSILEIQKMNAYVKSYITFFAFLAITKIVVSPILKKSNVPLLVNLA